jgi:hypothetical protein
MRFINSTSVTIAFYLPTISLSPFPIGRLFQPSAKSADNRPHGANGDRTRWRNSTLPPPPALISSNANVDRRGLSCNIVLVQPIHNRIETSPRPSYIQPQGVPLAGPCPGSDVLMMLRERRPTRWGLSTSFCASPELSSAVQPESLNSIRVLSFKLLNCLSRVNTSTIVSIEKITLLELYFTHHMRVST